MHQNIQFNQPDQNQHLELPWIQWIQSDGFRILADERFRELPVFGPLTHVWNTSPKCFISAGEDSKSIKSAERIWSWLDQENTDRGHVLLIVGGGTISDLGGFVASTFKRGIPFVLVPTTLVGMIDAAIGGKNGLNYSDYKNQIGTFQLPDLTYIDVNFISSLDALERTNGWMELVKHSLIADRTLWNEIQNIDIHLPGAIEPWVPRAAEIKKHIVAQDFLDESLRKSLNFGHTVAHALEWKAQQDDVQLSHGVAVGWGMLWSLAWSNSLLQTDSRDFELARRSIRMWLDTIPAHHQSHWLSALDPAELWPAMLKDKKNLDGAVLDVALTQIGEAIWNQPVTLNKFTSIWKQVFLSVETN